ncbi:MAG: alkaline phosphatase family protein, partial [Actinomycetota bacterium]|nr:alkaline phosphatase family protein [Actinomycetota bacterium]
LPHLREISERGARARLRNIDAYRSELVWVQFLTGKSALDHRWWGQIDFDPRTYAAYGRGTLDATPFYALGPGIPVVAFDLIHSVIADDVAGDQITAWGAHSPQYPRASRPAGLLTEIDRRFGTNPAFGNDFDIGWYEPDYIDNLAEACALGAHRRIEIAGWLQERVPDWRLFLTCMSEVHSVGHHYWHGVDDTHPLHGVAPTSELSAARFVEVCQAVDDGLGRFVASLPPDATLVVFALHGMKPSDDIPATLLLPELAHRLHFARPLLRDPHQGAWAAAGYPPVIPGRHQNWQGLMKDRFRDGRRDLLRHSLRRAPAPVYQLARRLAGRSQATTVGPLWFSTPPEADISGISGPGTGPVRENLDFQVSSWYRRHWPEMPWFVVPTFADAHVRLNVRGREGRGIVEPADYRKVRDEVVATIRQCRDPRTERPAVADVLFPRDDDPLAPDGPDADLLIVWSEALDALEHPAVGIVGPYPHMRTGSHSSNGFVFVVGPGVPAGADLGQRSAFDLTPTILTLAGLPVPEGMRGEPMLAPSPV